MRQAEPLTSEKLPRSHLNKSSIRPTAAIWFPSCQRQTTQKDAAESTGIHCRASLYRDLSGAGKPPLALPGPADFSRRGRGSRGRRRPNADPFCLLHKGNWARFASLTVDDVSLSKFSPDISTVKSLEDLGYNPEICTDVFLFPKFSPFESRVSRLTLAVANWYPAHWRVYSQLLILAGLLDRAVSAGLSSLLPR